jgi:hypothetical protein
MKIKSMQHNWSQAGVGIVVLTSLSTIFLSLNPAHGEMYSIQHYEMKFVSDWRQVSGFLQEFCFLHQ